MPSPGAWTVYSNAALALANAQIDLATSNFNLILVTNSYTPAPNTDSTYANVSANEVTGGGYTVGGVSLPTDSVTLTGGTVTFLAGNPSPWSAFSATFRYGVVVRRAGVSLAPSDLLLCYSDLGGGSSVTGTGTSLTVTMNAAGTFTITHSP